MRPIAPRTPRVPPIIAVSAIPVLGGALLAGVLMVASPAAAQDTTSGPTGAAQASPGEDFATEFNRRFRDDGDANGARSERRAYDPYYDDDDEHSDDGGRSDMGPADMGPAPRAERDQDRDMMSGRGDEGRVENRDERNQRGENSRDRRVDNSCGERAGRRIGRLLDRMERLTRPSGEQQQAFEKLRDASNKAIEISRMACPTEQALTPSGRLAAAEKRLETLLEAIRTVRPALDDFYRTLSEEQKARFYAATPPSPRERWSGGDYGRHSLGDGRLDAWRDEMRRRWRERWNDDDGVMPRRDMSRDDRRWQRRDRWRENDARDFRREGRRDERRQRDRDDEEDSGPSWNL